MRIQPISYYPAQQTFQNKFQTLSTNNSHATCNTINYFGYRPIHFTGTKTNYLIYDKEAGELKPLIITSNLSLEKISNKDSYFPKLKAYNADFSNGNISEVYMKDSSLPNSRFYSTKMFKTNLNHSNLSGCDFSQASAPSAKIIDSKLRGAKLVDTDFTRANLQKSNFDDCDCSHTNFHEANLIDTDFSNAKNLNSANLINAIYNKNTKFPEGYNPKEQYLKEFAPNGDFFQRYVGAIYVKSEDPYNFDNYRNMCFLEANLSKAQFVQLNMMRSNFDRANCIKTNFDNCILSGSSFRNCNLERANFQNCMLMKAQFVGENTNLIFANFIDADLSGSDFDKLSPFSRQYALFSDGTKFPEGFSKDDAIKSGMIYIGKGTIFRNRMFNYLKLNNINFSELDNKDFIGTTFYRTSINNSDFSGICLKNASFKKATLKNTNFSYTDCKETNFKKANLAMCNFENSNMTNADLRGADLSSIKYNKNTNFNDAKYDQNTIFPKGFEPEEHHMQYIECHKSVRER
ncbi:MAG: pentapeptide repeat-containing protein [Clostridiaceae bacterium]|nr:pentapeptide repeat-containing protein [Clostridiaceae bacterium]